VGPAKRMAHECGMVAMEALGEALAHVIANHFDSAFPGEDSTMTEQHVLHQLATNGD